jgi:hypothetical protein
MLLAQSGDGKNSLADSGGDLHDRRHGGLSFLWRLWQRDEKSLDIRTFYVATMGPVFVAATIYFAILAAWGIAAVTALAALFAAWRWKRLRT